MFGLKLLTFILCSGLSEHVSSVYCHWRSRHAAGADANVFEEEGRQHRLRTRSSRDLLRPVETDRSTDNENKTDRETSVVRGLMESMWNVCSVAKL